MKTSKINNMAKRGLPKGVSGNPNGRPPGVQNKTTVEFKEAVTNLINFATPKMVDWLTLIAAQDPNKALDHVYKFAQFGHPLLARTEMTGKDGKPIEVAWPLPKTRLDD